MKLEDITVKDFFIRYNIDINYFEQFFKNEIEWIRFLNFHNYFIYYKMKINNPEAIFFFNFIKKHYSKKIRLDKINNIINSH